MTQFAQKLFLVHHWGHRLLADHLGLTHFLHCEHLLALFGLHLPHLPETTLANRIQHVEHLFANGLHILRRRWGVAWFFAIKSYFVHLEQSIFISFLGTTALDRVGLFPSRVCKLHRHVITNLATEVHWNFGVLEYDRFFFLLQIDQTEAASSPMNLQPRGTLAGIFSFLEILFGRAGC